MPVSSEGWLKMTAGKKDFPDLFDDNPIDPMGSATGVEPGSGGVLSEEEAAQPEKKKAGFYLPTALLNRFDRKFHELKLAGRAVGNKSALLEAALTFALDDMDRGDGSRILKQF